MERVITAYKRSILSLWVVPQAAYRVRTCPALSRQRIVERIRNLEIHIGPPQLIVRSR